MASSSCTDLWIRSYQYEWHAWFNDFTKSESDGYAYSNYAYGNNQAFCFYFKTPSVNNFYKSTKLKLTIPVLRYSSSTTTGDLYVLLLTNDPTNYTPANHYDLRPSSSRYTAKGTWTSNSSTVCKVNIEISNDTLKPNTAYYVTIGSGNHALGVGYAPKEAGRAWEATLDYETYTNVGNGTVVVSDNYNNTFSINATKGSDGTNNTAKQLINLNYNYAGLNTSNYLKDPKFTFTNNKPMPLTLSGTDATRRVYAEADTEATLGTDGHAYTSSDIRQYIGPNNPDKSTLSISSDKSRLTLKSTWTLRWGAATKINDSSPVKGYTIRLYRRRKDSSGKYKVTQLPIRNGDGNDVSLYINNMDPHFDTNGSTRFLSIYAKHYGDYIKPGDEVYFSVNAFTRFGYSYTGAKCYAGAAVKSSVYAVQNAGVVRVKTAANTWKEGQVYIKISSNVWKEAEYIKVKTANGWKESE